MDHGISIVARAAVAAASIAGVGHAVKHNPTTSRPRPAYVICYEDKTRPMNCLGTVDVQPPQRLHMVLTVPTFDAYAQRECNDMGGRLQIQYLNRGYTKRYFCSNIDH